MPRGRPRKLPELDQSSNVVVETPRRPVGRPNTFEPWMCETLIDTFAQGQFIASFCVKVGIAERTFYRWVQDHPALAEAYEDAKTACKAYYEAHLAAQAVSSVKAPNFNQIAMILNNRFSDDYKRGTHGESSTTTITNNYLKYENLSNDDLTKKLDELLRIRDESNKRTIDGTYTVITGEEAEGTVQQVLTDVPGDGEVLEG